MTSRSQGPHPYLLCPLGLLHPAHGGLGTYCHPGATLRPPPHLPAPFPPGGGGGRVLGLSGTRMAEDSQMRQQRKRKHPARSCFLPQLIWRPREGASPQHCLPSCLSSFPKTIRRPVPGHALSCSPRPGPTLFAGHPLGLLPCSPLHPRGAAPGLVPPLGSQLTGLTEAPCEPRLAAAPPCAREDPTHLQQWLCGAGGHLSATEDGVSGRVSEPQGCHSRL